MTWTYVQLTGALIRPDGTLLAHGYSGFGDGLNEPGRENIKSIGPLPVGTYNIGDPYDHPHLGPCVMDLDYVGGPGAFGRSLFRMHGDNAAHAHTASHGCIIMPPWARYEVANSDDGVLTVVARP